VGGIGGRGSAVWDAKLGSDESPRRGRQVKGQSRGTAWRAILQEIPVTIPPKKAKNHFSSPEPNPFNRQKNPQQLPGASAHCPYQV
jgi:hypothetical protein